MAMTMVSYILFEKAFVVVLHPLLICFVWSCATISLIYWIMVITKILDDI